MEGLWMGSIHSCSSCKMRATLILCVEVLSLFFQDSDRLLNHLTTAIHIGAQRVKNACIAFRNFCEEQNIEACFICLQQVKQEYLLVRNKLETLFRLEQQILDAGGSIPMME